MSAYAPLFVNMSPGGMEWASDLIGYDPLTSYGSPGYYAQVMLSSCLGDHTVASTVTGAGEKFFYSATVASNPKKLCLKLVNGASSAQSASLSLAGLGSGSHQGRVLTLKGNTIWATKAIQKPDRIKPETSTLNVDGEKLTHQMPAYSIQVLETKMR